MRDAAPVDVEAASDQRRRNGFAAKVAGSVEYEKRNDGATMLKVMLVDEDAERSQILQEALQQAQAVAEKNGNGQRIERQGLTRLNKPVRATTDGVRP